MFHKVDCIRIKVPNLEEGLRYYHHHLGHEIIWKTPKAIGLRLIKGDSEIIIHTTEEGVEVDFMVENVESTLEIIISGGGKVIKGPFEIDIGKCAVIQDPWGNEYVILDSMKGNYTVDKNQEVIGVEKKG